MDNEAEKEPTEMEKRYVNEDHLATEEAYRDMQLVVAELEDNLAEALEEDLETQHDLLENLLELNVMQKDELRS